MVLEFSLQLVAGGPVLNRDDGDVNDVDVGADTARWLMEPGLDSMFMRKSLSRPLARPSARAAWTRSGGPAMPKPQRTRGTPPLWLFPPAYARDFIAAPRSKPAHLETALALWTYSLKYANHESATVISTERPRLVPSPSALDAAVEALVAALGGVRR
ncbi:MAG: hypothetical protein A2413_06955 [Treponema sp. RIFOXYC1_FULL_61_9]|nr:MAG: hypothetical protein A2413_06955 [Treponema sp. RIFOXYC1_FULL_61_9]